MNIHQHDVSSVLRVLPPIVEFDPSRSYDLVIATVGFEDRTASIVEALAGAGSLAESRLLLVDYPTNPAENAANQERFTSSAAEERTARIGYCRHSFVSALAGELERLSPGSQVLLDMSTCSSYILYPTLRALFDCEIALTVSYTEADVYYPTYDEWSKIAQQADREGSLLVEAFETASFQSVGVAGVYPGNLFSEMNPGNRPSVLIAVPNFSCLRMSAILGQDWELNKTPREEVVWIIGDPPAEENRWRRTAVERTNTLEQMSREHRHYVSTLEYKDMIKLLEDIWQDRRYSHNLTIGSLGSKMQHLGTFIFLAMHQDVGIWLSEPEEFKADRFSEGSGSQWQVEFGSVVGFLERMQSYREFKWQY